MTGAVSFCLKLCMQFRLREQVITLRKQEEIRMDEMLRVEIILYVRADILDKLIDKIKKELYTGHIGGGKIFCVRA